MFNQCVQKSVVSLSSKKTNLCQKCAYGDACIRSSSPLASAAITLPQVLRSQAHLAERARGNHAPAAEPISARAGCCARCIQLERGESRAASVGAPKNWRCGDARGSKLGVEDEGAAKMHSQWDLAATGAVLAKMRAQSPRLMSRRASV